MFQVWNFTKFLQKFKITKFCFQRGIEKCIEKCIEKGHRFISEVSLYKTLPDNVNLHNLTLNKQWLAFV